MNIQCDNFSTLGFNLEEADRAHATQVCHPKYNPNGLSFSENCGPTSLLIALRLLGVPVRALPFARPPRDAQQEIDSVRYYMFSNESGNAVDSTKMGLLPTAFNYIRLVKNHQTLIGLADLQRGCRNLRVRERPLESVQCILSSLRRRQPVIVGGDPSHHEAYGKRLGIDYRGGHAVVVSGYQEGSFLLNDPLSLGGPFSIKTSELESFLSARPFEDKLGLSIFL